MTWTRLAEIASVRSFVLALVFGLLQAWPQITAWRMANWKAKSFCIFLVLGIFFAGLQYVTSGTFLGQAKEHQPQVPLLEGQIDGSYIGRFSQGTPSTAITLVVSIRNRGAPSIVEDWSLSVIPPGGTPLSATHYFIPETLTLEREHGSPVT